MMYSVEIQTPITMNDHFAVMTRILVESLARNAEFPGKWKIVFTVSLDSELGPHSSQFAWASDYPVEFRMVDRSLWERIHYEGTGLQSVEYEHDSDVILYMDADTVVINSLREMTERIAADNAIFGWPAWFSGGMDFDALFRAAGIESMSYKLTYLRDGVDHTAPNWPPYFNFGFIGVSKGVANDMRTSFSRDLHFVLDNFPNYFTAQVALTLNIVRNNYEHRAIGENYNVGSDHHEALTHYATKLGRHIVPSQIAMADPRVLHYCFPTSTLQKRRDMANWASLRTFVERPGLAGFERLLQRSLKKLSLSELDENAREHENRGPAMGA